MHMVKVDPAEDYYLDYLGTRRMDDAMDSDAEADARPMVVPINQPSDVRYAFSGALIYDRGTLPWEPKSYLC
jgi:hypothetical protein